MAVRGGFNGTSNHDIVTSVGALAGSGFGTYAAIVKRGATGAWHTIMALHNSAETALNQFAFRSNDTMVWWIDGISIQGPAAIGTADWGLIVVRKATGTATPRFSLYNFTTATWTHGNGDGSVGNWSTGSTDGTVRMAWQGGDRYNGRIAVRAAWNSLPWTADASGDAAIEAAGLEVSTANWLNASPDMLHQFNQPAVSDPVLDETAGGADETSRIGTVVVTDDDPPGFVFSGGGITGTGALTPAAATTDGDGVVVVSGTGGLDSPPSSTSGAGVVPVTGSGALSAPSATAGGDADALIGGSGALTPSAAQVSGLGGSGSISIGNGTLTPSPATLTGVGALLVGGDGELNASPATFTGAGSVLISGDGELTAPPAQIIGITADAEGELTAPPAEVSGAGIVKVPSYSFSPPTVEESTDVEHPDPYVSRFLSRIKRTKGIALVLEGGLFVESRVVTQNHYDGKADGVDYFKGGFVYSGIPKEVADLLVASGYQPELED